METSRQMNREQMIAWLTLEGWEPMRLGIVDGNYSLYRGVERIRQELHREGYRYIPESEALNQHEHCGWWHIEDSMLQYAVDLKGEQS